ncbi:ArsC family reductase [Uliginosibacterium sp. sgz301328]|uniref:ArsC family reductase n=1 Tax=Uliginosibacterium sp. sgz301328 TaxID=3243764 RepID=UPI00359DB795
MVKVFGIKNCNTMKKAFDWLDAHGIPYDFHDYKKFGITQQHLAAWAAQIGWEPLLNTRGTTWRGLTDAERTGVDEARAIELMSAKPSLIKRPVIEHDGRILVGFDEAAYLNELGA